MEGSRSIIACWHIPALSVIVVRISQVGILRRREEEFRAYKEGIDAREKPNGADGGHASRYVYAGCFPSASLSWYNTPLRYLWTAFGTCRAKLINVMSLIKRMGEAFDVRTSRSWRFDAAILENTRKLSISRNSGNSKNFDKPCIGRQVNGWTFQFRILNFRYWKFEELKFLLVSLKIKNMRIVIFDIKILQIERI